MIKELPDIVFNNWQKGIAESPFVGTANLYNADISSAPGCFRAGFISTKTSANVIGTGNLPQWIVKNPSEGGLFALDSNGHVYGGSQDGTTWTSLGNTNTNGNGNGLGVYQNYLYVARDTNLDKYGPLNGSPSWSYGIQTLTSSVWHPMIWGQDDILYIGNGSTLASLNGSVWESAALTLASKYFIKCLAELGQNLMIGTYGGTNYPIIADVLPWDRISATYNYPLIFSGDGINAMVTCGQILYVFHGKTGDISITQGASITKVKTLHHSLNNTSIIYPGAVMNFKGKPYFSFGPGSDLDIYRKGIYTLDGVESNTPVVLSCVATIPDWTGTDSNGIIGALCPVGTPTGYEYAVGWLDNTSATAGINIVAKSGYRNTSGGTLDTQMTRVGTPFHKRNFDNLTFELEKPLATGESIQILYRTNTTDSFVSIDTWSFATYGAIQSNVVNSSFPNYATENIQLRAIITPAANSTATPGLLEIRLSGGT